MAYEESYIVGICFILRKMAKIKSNRSVMFVLLGPNYDKIAILIYLKLLIRCTGTKEAVGRRKVWARA